MRDLHEFVAKEIPERFRELEFSDIENMSEARKNKRLRAVLKIKEEYKKWQTSQSR